MTPRWVALWLGAALLVAVVILAARAGAADWQRAHVTAYASFEALVGCYRPGQCRTACGQLLDDRRYTVAANPRHGLRCGQRIVVCGERCHAAVVNDRTASYFDFEFSFALACATGASCSRAGFDSPRWVRWKSLPKGEK